MKLVTVIPIARGVFRDTLTYWSGKEVALGAIVTVTVRSRPINALVVGVEDAGAAKANIKSAPFALKKITGVKPDIFMPEFIRASERTAKYFATSMGSVLQAFTPKNILDVPISVPFAKNKPRTESKNLKIEKLAFQTNDDERLTSYKSLVREEFAKKFSVFICFPTIEDVKRSAVLFEKGIKEYTFVFHSGLSKKTMLLEWARALKEKHPIVILATPSFISIPRDDIKTIIVEEENSRSYKTIQRPELDMRIFAEYYAEEHGAKLILGDSFLRTETIHRYNERELLEFTAVKFRLFNQAAGTIIDMKKSRDTAVGKTWSALSYELRALIELNHREHENMFILAGRRGLAPTTVCNDCGTIVSCKNCGAPLVLHENKKGLKVKNEFLCHKCEAKQTIEKDGEDRCEKCGSWRLAPLGVGIENVSMEIKAELPELKIFRIDSDTVKTDTAITKIINDFYNTRGAVLIGTEMALPYLQKPVDSSAIVGIDSYLIIPDFRINEKIFSLILSLRTKTRKAVILQTQEPERGFFDYALRGDLLPFYRKELLERKKFNYPPFTVLIKISWETKYERAEKETSDTAARLEGYSIHSYISPIPGKKTGLRANILIKIPHDKWVDEKLLAILKKLSPKYTVSVDPDSLF
ncbi:MAG: primosomal protein N' [Candidatus Paceibacterota bacterium]|jgi:primosomal protein N' (replication factor Y)